jgi:hypothetical protein
MMVISVHPCQCCIYSDINWCAYYSFAFKSFNLVCLLFFSLESSDIILIGLVQIIDGIPNASAVQLDVMDDESLCKYISLVKSSFYAI